MWPLLIALAAAPAPLPEIPAPLGHIGNVVGPVPKGGLPDADKLVVVSWEGCEPQAISLMRYLGGCARTIEQLQTWLTDGAQEPKLFPKNTLGGVMRHLTDARLEPKRSCEAPALEGGFRLALTAPARKWCPAEGARAEGDYWFFNKDRPAAVVQISKGAPDACKPRISAVLFDARGVARLRLHSDWGGEMSATLVGDKCQQVDFTLDKARQSFVATPKSCKR